MPYVSAGPAAGQCAGSLSRVTSLTVTGAIFRRGGKFKTGPRLTVELASTCGSSSVDPNLRRVVSLGSNVEGDVSPAGRQGARRGRGANRVGRFWEILGAPKVSPPGFADPRFAKRRAPARRVSNPREGVGRLWPAILQCLPTPSRRQGVPMVPGWMRAGLAVTVAWGLTTACGSRAQTRPATTVPPPAPVATAAPASPRPSPPADPVTTLIADSQRHFEAGQRELSIGHLDRARAEFDQALEVLLGSQYGARYEPRLREHFDRLVDQISAYEVTALAQGDGFTEKRYEPASIDALLELSTTFVPDSPAGSAALKERVASDLEHTAHDIDIPLNERVLTYVELFQGRLREWIADGLDRGARYLPDDPGRVPRRGAAARPRVRPARSRAPSSPTPCRAPRRRASGSSWRAPRWSTG